MGLVTRWLNRVMRSAKGMATFQAYVGRTCGWNASGTDTPGPTRASGAEPLRRRCAGDRDGTPVAVYDPPANLELVVAAVGQGCDDRIR